MDCQHAHVLADSLACDSTMVTQRGLQIQQAEHTAATGLYRSRYRWMLQVPGLACWVQSDCYFMDMQAMQGYGKCSNLAGNH